MNAKYALALILTLQVSMSLCDIPPPSDELVQKYNEMKDTFFQRLMKVYGKMQVAAAPYMEQAGNHENGQKAREYLETLQTKPEFQAAVKVASGVVQEITPLVDQVRTSVLGLYEQHLRPRFGESMSNAIDRIKVFLDKHLPSE